MSTSGVMLVPLDGQADTNNPSARLALIRSQIRFAESRVKDLEYLLSKSILGQEDTGEFVPGVDNTDENAIRQELYAARSFEGFLRTAENFWNQIRETNKQAEGKLHEFIKGTG